MVNKTLENTKLAAEWVKYEEDPTGACHEGLELAEKDRLHQVQGMLVHLKRGAGNAPVAPLTPQGRATEGLRHALLRLSGLTLWTVLERVASLEREMGQLRKDLDTATAARTAMEQRAAQFAASLRLEGYDVELTPAERQAAEEYELTPEFWESLHAGRP